MLGSGEMKRFYKQAAAAAAEGGFEVQLDGRAVRTPGRALLLLPTRPLAEAVAAEWAAQEAQVRTQDMALMSLSCTALDLVRPHRAAVVAEPLHEGIHGRHRPDDRQPQAQALHRGERVRGRAREGARG